MCALPHLALSCYFPLLATGCCSVEGTPAGFKACDTGGAKLRDLVTTYKGSWASDVAVKLTVNIH